jgi:hypothetical protein
MVSRPPGSSRRGVGLAVLLLLLPVSCSDREPPSPIRLTGTTMTVENRTAEEWTGVEVWVNDHYRVTKASMAAGEQFIIPLTAFVAGFGQRFDPKRQVVQGVEVTAKTRSGTPITLIHGRGRRR